MALQAGSFERAAEDYTAAVGGDISRMSTWRVTTGGGAILARRKEVEAERAMAVPERGESPRAERIAVEQPIAERANISSDGTMILVRGEGWKEMKMAAISRVRVEPPGADDHRKEGRRAGDPVVHLDQHSYVAGLWGPDEFAKYQYAEGLRRGLDHVPLLSSVNDGALWIERVTATNFPRAVQIVDWSHSSGHVHLVAKGVFGEGSAQAAAWAAARLDDLWAGNLDRVVDALRALPVDAEHCPDEVRQAPRYFESNRGRMRYPEFRAAGHPLGSGTVESGGKNVIHQRMRRPGRGWARHHGQEMAFLLCEYHSGRFEATWDSLSRPAG